MITPAQRKALDDVIAGAPDRTLDIGSSLDMASRRDPEKYAKSLTLADSLQLPVDTVERNIDEVERRDKLRRIDLPAVVEKSPKTAAFMSNPDNATLALDDLDILRGMEETTGQSGRTWLQTAGDTGIDFSKGTIGLGQSVVGIADILTFNVVGDAMEAMGYAPEEANQMLSQYYSGPRKIANTKVAKAKGFVGTLEALINNPSVAFGMAVESAPMMLGTVAAARAAAMRLLAGAGIAPGTPGAAAFLARPDVVAKLATVSAGTEGALAAGSLQESARAAGRDWQETVVQAIGTGVGTALIGKLSSKILPDVEATTATALLARDSSRKGILDAGKTIAAGVFKEGVLEELPQSAQEQIWSNLAMDRPWDEGVTEAGAQGMVLGMGMGGGMATFNETLGALTARAGRETETAMKSVIDQGALDQNITYAQEMKLRGLAPERMREFLRQIGPDVEIFIPADIAAQIPDVPDYIAEQIDGTGVDVAIPADRFYSEIIDDEEMMALLRPHLKLHQDGLSATELEEMGDTSLVKTLLERATASKDIRTEADEIYERVKSQIVGTDRQSETTARLSAMLIPAYAAAKAERLGISAGEVFTQMGLRIEAAPVEMPAAAPGVILDQARAVGYEGIDQAEASEWSAAVTKGLPMDEASRMERARDWAADSAVADEAGEPMVVYHGTPGPAFEAFDPERKGITTFIGIPVETERSGFFFAEDEDFAKTFAEQDGERRAGTVMPVYLSIKKPFRTFGGAPKESDLRAVMEAGVATGAFDEAGADWFDGMVHRDDFWEVFDDENGIAVREAMIAAGFDGVSMTETDPDTGETKDVWVVFNPEQVRSTDAAFDPARREEALLLAQPPAPAFEAEQDFADIEITDEMTVEETGEVVTVTQDAQTVWNRLQKRRNMVDQLRGCLNA